MKTLNPYSFAAFQDELEKVAGFSELVASQAGRLKNMGSLGGVGTLGGAALGAGALGAHSFQQAHEQGASLPVSAVHGLRGALGGAVLGGTAGAVVGGGAGVLAKGNFDHLTKSTLPGVGAFARAGQRQVHGFTGMLSPQELRNVRGGAYDAVRNLNHTLASNPIGSKPAARALDAANAAVKAEGMGLNSVPGYLRSLKNNGVANTVRAGVEEQFKNAPVMTALGMGMPLASAAATAFGKKDEDYPTPLHPSKAQQLGTQLGNFAGGVMSAAMPMGTGAAVGLAGSALGRGAGKVYDRLRHTRPVQEPPETNGLGAPVEHVMSDSAAGRPPEVVS